jgi:trk system potassium uptake protein TrkH
LSRRFSTPRLIIYGLVALVALGTGLLKLPASTESGISRVDAFFVSVSCGFATVDYAELQAPTLVVQALLMFVGTTPTASGGGVKVTTVALVFLTALSQVRGEDRITLPWRELPRALVANALSTVLIVLGTLTIMISDGPALLPALSEITSAFGTTGLSLSVTPNLSPFGMVFSWPS